jgi:CMP-N-acetylneuraminic acid synthetase
MTYLGIIPARAGSKRIPQKNLAPLAGRPLLDYTVDAALQATRLAAVTVSTDSERIAAHARSRGIRVPQLRPERLATDSSPTVHAVAHAMEAYEAATGLQFSAIVILQPTSPFRTAAHVDAAVEQFERAGVDTLTAVRASPDHPYWSWQVHESLVVPFFSWAHIEMDRALLPPAYIETGAIYVVARSLVEQGRLYGERVAGFVMDEVAAVDIDTPLDLEWARFLIERGLAKPGGGAS